MRCEGKSSLYNRMNIKLNALAAYRQNTICEIRLYLPSTRYLHVPRKLFNSRESSEPVILYVYILHIKLSTPGLAGQAGQLSNLRRWIGQGQTSQKDFPSGEVGFALARPLLSVVVVVV